jgi:hypothetical protein
MSSFFKFAAAFAAAVSIAILAAFTPPVSVLDNLPMLNTAGDAVFASAVINDNAGSGVVTTVAAAGTFVTIGNAAPLAAGPSDGSGGIAYVLDDNTFRINRFGSGDVELKACLTDLIGTNAQLCKGAWHRLRGGTTTRLGPVIHDCTEPTTAARKNRGCAELVTAAQVGDRFDFRLDSGGSGDTLTTRGAFFSAKKIVSR